MARNYWADRTQLGFPAFQWRYRRAASLVRGRVIDAACGYGSGSAILAKRATEVLGYDKNAQYIAAAGSLCQAENVTYVRTNLETTGWKPPVCTWFVSLETIEHLLHPRSFIERAQGLSQEGVIVSTPIWDGIPVEEAKAHSKDFHQFTSNEVLSWFGSGWELVMDERWERERRYPEQYRIFGWKRC